MHKSSTLEMELRKKDMFFAKELGNGGRCTLKYSSVEKDSYSLKVRGSEFLLEDTKPLGKISLVYDL
ncbi:hypothetical protein PAEVO_54390 [Paenibacillus sp. GM2FR]|nr:hypothetical protein PAEVO_54390 [Paenibacillus sp. GM2FR]